MSVKETNSCSSLTPFKSPLSEKLHVFQPCSFYLLRHHISLIISVCQDKELENIYIPKSLKYQIGLKHAVHSGYQLQSDIQGDKSHLQVLSFSLPPSGSENYMWEAQKTPTPRLTSPQGISSLSPMTWRDMQHHCDPDILPGGQGRGGMLDLVLNVWPARRWLPLRGGNAHTSLQQPSCFPQWPVTQEPVRKPMTKPPARAIARKDGVRWTNQREGLDSHHRAVGVWQEREKKQEGSGKNMDMELTKDNLTLLYNCLNLQLYDTAETLHGWERHQESLGMQAGNRGPCAFHKSISMSSSSHHPNPLALRFLSLHTF